VKVTISQLRLPYNHSENSLLDSVVRLLKLKEKKLVESLTIKKKSIDARKKHQLIYTYTVDVVVKGNCYVDNKTITLTKEEMSYVTPFLGLNDDRPPIVIGTGPAGLFCALILAEAGLKPVVYERGSSVDDRLTETKRFFETGELDEDSNIQFGEGGAGTFSDGKLSTGVKDKFGRKEKVLNTFYEAGAKEEILYVNKPHIGTDYLIKVVKNMRERIIDLGGTIHFNQIMSDIHIEEQTVKSIMIGNNKEDIPVNHLVLAIGHSARDTFKMLASKTIDMEQKAFAVGLRIEHPQTMINESQYGKDADMKYLPTADYKLTYRTKKGRAVYSFCMCPGGYVVNSSSEKGHVVCNGMSYFNRDSHNANAALLVNVNVEDFSSADILAGVEFQRMWEKKAFEIGGGSYQLPIQTLKDFKDGHITTSIKNVKPNIKGQYKFADLNECLPGFICDAIKEAVPEFDKKIKGFDRDDAVLTGVETRSSSPIRIIRDDQAMSNVKGLYPCGEGAGYAGGIMSAAIDGIKVAEAIIKTFQDNQ